MNLTKHLRAIWISLIIAVIAISFLGDLLLLILAYVTEFVICCVRAFQAKGRKRVIASMIIVFLLILVIQLIFVVNVVFIKEEPFYLNFTERAVALLFFVGPALVGRYAVVDKYARFYLPSVEDVRNISFEELKNITDKLQNTNNKVKNIRKSLSIENIKEVVTDLSRHDNFRYVNNGSLTKEYFDEAKARLDDTNIYIALSYTGSPASEIIGIFTQKKFNHASLSFDHDLRTVISYNGGERVYPPGLNPEDLREKNGVHLLVYSLKCSVGQKSALLEKIIEINNQGSAYNVIGLVTKHSAKANIMFCSQFVYKMLEHAGLTYFDKPAGFVTPTDLVELDFYRKLKFEYEIIVE